MRFNCFGRGSRASTGTVTDGHGIHGRPASRRRSFVVSGRRTGVVHVAPTLRSLLPAALEIRSRLPK